MHPFRKTNRSAYVNYLRAKYETYTGAIEAQSYPYFLCLDPSDKCQLRCPTCPTGMENESRRSKSGDPLLFRKDRETLSTDLLDAVLDEMGDYLFLINFYNYGEPLLNRQMPSFLKKASARDIDTEIHTNLSLTLTDEFIEDLLTSGLDHLHASIDGFSQETYQIHRVGGNLAMVKDNLERFVKTRDRLRLNTDITYNFLVFSFNEHEIPDARAYCRDLGINFNNRDAFVDDPGWLPTYRKQEQPWVVPESIRLRDDRPVGWAPQMPGVDPARCPPACGWHHGFTVVTAGGAVAPCCAIAKEKDDFGVVVPGETRFADIWNNDLFKASRAAFSPDGHDRPQVETICTKCPYPKFLHHLYSIHDAQVIAQFDRAFGYSDPVLRRAFDLLSQARANRSVAELVDGDGIGTTDHLFVGNENPKNTAQFVEYLKQNILEMQAPAASLQTS